MNVNDDLAKQILNQLGVLAINLQKIGTELEGIKKHLENIAKKGR